MAPVKSVLAAALLATAVLALPHADAKANTLSAPILRKINGPLKSLPARDRARVNALRNPGASSAGLHPGSGGLAAEVEADINTSAVNMEVVYTTVVNVGNPPTGYNLIIDTGSANTWVGSDKAYKKTATSIDQKLTVAVNYGSSDMAGEEFLDQVMLATGLVVKNQSIGVATSSDGFDGVDGVLGLGPTVSSTGTVSNNKAVTSVTDNLFAQKQIPLNLIALAFQPSSTANLANGEITWGGTDSTHFTGAITYTPLTTTFPSSQLWGLNLAINYGTTSVLGARSAGIVDAGTNLILIATSAFQKYQSASGGVLDAKTGLLKVTTAQYNALKPLNFALGGTTLSLTANGQIFPRALNTAIGGAPGVIYLVVNDIGSNDSGMEFVLGMYFLERFYAVFDSQNKRIGFANTPFTTSTKN